MVGAVAVAALPAQYVPVLFRHDREFLVLGFIPVAIGAAVTGFLRRSDRRDVATAVVATGVLYAAATVGYRLYGGVGLPDPLDVATVIGMVAAAAAAAGSARRRLRYFGPPALMTLVVAVTIAGVMFAAAKETPGSPSRCTTRSGVEFCHFAGYDAFIDKWAPAVLGVVAAIPPASRSQLPPVVQADRGRTRTNLATPGLDWDRPHDGTAELALALDTANTLLGITSVETCEDARDGRWVVAFWLAGQATPEAGDALRGLNRFADSISGSTYAEPLIGEIEAARDAARLLRLPRQEVRARLQANWHALADPSISRADAVGLLTGTDRTTPSSSATSSCPGG